MTRTAIAAMLKGADARLFGQKGPLKRIDVEQFVPLLIG